MVEVPPPAAASSASPPPIPLPIASASIDHAGIAAKAHPPASHSTPGTAGTLSNASNSSWVCPSNRVYPGLVNLSSSPKSGDAADTTGSCTDSSQPFTPFFFATLADTQLGAIDNNTSWEEEKVLCRMAVQKLNNLTPRPQFAIVCGDLVHHFPRMYPHTDPAIRDRQVADFKVPPFWPRKNLSLPPSSPSLPPSPSLRPFLARSTPPSPSCVSAEITTWATPPRLPPSGHSKRTLATITSASGWEG